MSGCVLTPINYYHGCRKGVFQPKAQAVNPGVMYRVRLKNNPVQKFHYFRNNLIFFGEIFRGYS